MNTQDQPQKKHFKAIDLLGTLMAPYAHPAINPHDLAAIAVKNCSPYEGLRMIKRLLTLTDMDGGDHVLGLYVAIMSGRLPWSSQIIHADGGGWALYEPDLLKPELPTPVAKVRPRLTSTHTLAELEVSKSAFDEIAGKLKEADYDHAFDGEERIDMSGIALVAAL